ncbi:hypothetical protein LCI18_010835 [Fusarium solani-melongenae]|uniref:Uncharacterized protein n=1 Tax=Fusarium solani subsp. cucurbitae TaxID=2747967 RepID=A0ACD3ZFA1_FUSSC|nr:hypothetical protein LCI18_010835 [Fusarium solani-melongenae]
MSHQVAPLRGTSYLDFVRFRAKANLCIASLHEHLQHESRAASKIVYLDYRHNESSKFFEPVSAVQDDLVRLVEEVAPSSTRFLLVENVTSAIVSTLGEALDIDPLFFADYIDSPLLKFRKAMPPSSLATLPSLVVTRDHIHLHHYQFVTLSSSHGSIIPYALMTGSNIPRKVRQLAPISGRQLFLAWACCSFIIKSINTSQICIFLVDPPINAVDVPDAEPHRSYQAKVLGDGFENFESPPSFSSFAHGKTSHSLNKTSMLDRIVYYLQTQQPPGFHVNSPSILSVGYYPIRIVLSEWSFYAHLTSRCSKYDQYSITNKPGQLRDEDLAYLQRWRRRSKRGKQRLDILVEVINFRMQYEDEKEPWGLILKDVNWIRKLLQEYCESLEQMVTVATSMVQLLDSRRSMLEAVNMRRLTYIAMIFIPLAWVASLFSMSDAYTPGNESFWVYVTTALPILGIVLGMSILPYDRMYKALRYVWDKRRGIQDIRKMSRLPQGAV